MKSLAEGEKGFSYLSHILVIMLQTLLQDGVAEVRLSASSLCCMCCFVLFCFDGMPDN